MSLNGDHCVSQVGVRAYFRFLPTAIALRHWQCCRVMEADVEGLRIALGSQAVALDPQPFDGVGPIFEQRHHRRQARAKLTGILRLGIGA